MLVSAWAPMFLVNLGLPRDQLLELSIPEMVDHLDYWADVRGSQDG